MKKIPNISYCLILFAFIINTGCAVHLPKAGNAPPNIFYNDGTHRQVVEKDWGKPIKSETYFEYMLNMTIYFDTYRIRYQNSSYTWVDYEQIFSYYNDEIMNRMLSYYALVGQLFYDTRIHKKSPKVIILPFKVDSSQTVNEDLRLRFISAISRSLPNIRVIERSQIDAILKEHHFNMTMTDINESIEVGRLVGANYMVNVNCRFMGNNSIGTNNFDAIATLINVETGEIEATAMQAIW